MMRVRRGMTLMELTVALVVTAFMATIGVAAFTSIINHRHTILTATIDTERASALRLTLRTWIGSGTIAVSAGGAPTGRATAATAATAQQSTITAAVSTGDEITFTTSALTPAGTPNVSVRLFIDGDPNTLESGLTIEYRTAQQAPLVRRQIDPMFVDAYGVPQPLQSMTVEFLDQRTSRWYSYSEAMTIQPIAARITFPVVDGTMPPPPLLQLPMVFAMTQQATTTGRGG